MKLILTTLIVQTFIRKTLCKISDGDLTSNRTMRAILVKYSSEYFGREGRDWRIVQNPKGHLAPFRAEAATGDTITIE